MEKLVTILNRNSPLPSFNTSVPIESGQLENLHYSSVISLSKQDVQQIREILIKTIERIKPIIQRSPEETLYGFSMDFFGM